MEDLIRVGKGLPDLAENRKRTVAFSDVVEKAHNREVRFDSVRSDPDRRIPANLVSRNPAPVFLQILRHPCVKTLQAQAIIAYSFIGSAV